MQIKLRWRIGKCKMFWFSEGRTKTKSMDISVELCDRGKQNNRLHRCVYQTLATRFCDLLEKKGWDLPVHPPSVFATSPSFSRQTVSEDRQVSQRKVDSDSRRESEGKRRKDKDKFESWSEIVKCARTVILVRCVFDEIYIKPSIRKRGNHMIRKSVDQPEKAAKTILALMVCCSVGGPTFVARLIPMHTLKHEFLSEQLEKLLHIIHDSGGFVFLLMSDNLRCNQSTFNESHKKYETVKEWPRNHPIPNSEFNLLFLLYDPTHLLKNIRNNWITEKTQTLRFTDPDTVKIVETRWRDLIEIYKEESQTIIKNTKFDYSILYPTNLEKQKVHLACNIFNEKTSVELLCRENTDTAVFVEAVTKLWNILNIKNPNTDKRLNDPHRMKFETPKLSEIGIFAENG